MVTILSLLDDRKTALEQAAKELEGGRLVVFPTDTVYGIGANAFNPFATAMIFQVKNRPRSVPLPVLVASPKQAWALAARVPREATTLAEAFWPGPLTLVLPEADFMDWDLGETGGGVAVRMPNQADLLDLIRSVGPLAATSANLSGERTPGTVQEIAERLGHGVSLYLDGGPAPGEIPSTIVDLTGGSPRVRREGIVSAADIADALEKSPGS